MTELAPEMKARQRWMSVLAKADADQLISLWKGIDRAVDYTFLRAPEFGLVMSQGRISGTGAPFNLGELTVTRASVRLSDERIGHAYVSGRSKQKAEIAAVVDALMQGDDRTDLETVIIRPLETVMQAERERHARKAAATKVDFFTLARSATVK